MTPLEQVRQALEYLYAYVADNDPDATWAEVERKLQAALAALPRIEQLEADLADALDELCEAVLQQDSNSIMVINRVRNADKVLARTRALKEQP